MTLDVWMKSGRYLPKFMRDFHDQKDIFRAIHHTIDVECHSYAKEVGWVVGQCYVIDIFLWYMAKRGYTLQPSRKKFEFGDIDMDIAAMKEHRATVLRAALSPAERGDL